MTSRSHRIVLVVLVALVASPAPVCTLAAMNAPASVFTGSVHDGVGHTLSRVLMLLTPIGARDEVRTTLTDLEGRYQFEGVPFGAYRITAIKDGYSAAVGRISSWFGRRLDLVLAEEAGSGARPHRPDWVMTAPPRDLLREIDARTLVTAAEDGLMPEELRPYESARTARMDLSRISEAARRFLVSLTGRMEQSFSESRRGPDSGPAISGGTGRSSRLLIGSPIGEHAAWDLQGWREKQTTSLTPVASEPGVRLDARQALGNVFRAGLRVGTPEAGRLDVRAYYDRDEYSFDRAGTNRSAPPLENRERRAWGYDADWRASVGAGASLQVDLRYAGSAVGAHMASRGAPSTAGAGEDDSSTRTTVWRTSAHVSKKLGTAHSVDFRVRAGLYSLGAVQGERVVPSTSQDPAVFTAVGRNGWTVSVNAAESWSMTVPFALNFGVDASRTISYAGSQLEAIVPQAGVTFTPSPSTKLRGLLSYVAARRYDAYAGGEPVQALGEPIGYRVRLERAFGEGLTLVLDAESRPFFYDFIGAGWGSASGAEQAHSLYFSDAAARVRETSLTLETRPMGGIVLGFGGGGGHVEGRVAASLPDADLLRPLDERDLRYTLARFDGKIEPSGTELRVHLMRVGERDGASVAGESYSDRRVEVELLQDLAFLHPGDTQWSILVSYRACSTGKAVRARFLEAADSDQWNALSRIRGGISVRF